jgi:Calcineurin-like phosphoesterase
MLKDFAASVPPVNRPSFFFHLGDVVYYYGEQQYYYDQFYHPYKEYPGPILAIPGNHDGITHPNGVSSLQGFISGFCDDKPRFWKEAGGIKRTTMTQPGVYFTLDAPLVSATSTISRSYSC